MVSRMTRSFWRMVLGLALIGATCAPAAAQRVTQPPPLAAPLVDSRLLAAGAGAITGVVAFNILTAPLGVVPLAGGVLAVVPTSVAMGSRLIAVVTAGAGALGATWLYDRWTGTQSDYAYLLTLGAGALVGVAVGNYLSYGALGTPPYYVGAGVANAAATLASPAVQAASRVYVIGSAVLGAFVADYLYRR
jgi:hypothetical protein